MDEHSSHCPACGTVLAADGGSEGLCPGCLLELALESPSLLAELEGPAEAETLAAEEATMAPGAILGGRYRIRSLLGRGGMGEVWRAFDLKLRVDVALKSLHTRLLADNRALETLRQEVRSAREVVSPNVCRVYDLEELDGRELVSMEYVDGTTLLEILRTRSPLELGEAQEIASQFLAGLEAIHGAGLVHRDIKPENLMITRTGRVVVMDFGIAKGLAERRSGTVSGTPAYMAPEQARAEAPDARADVFSAGVVLAEMASPDGVRKHEARQRIWEAIHRDPPEAEAIPWAPVVKQAVARDKARRYPSAAALARALEEVTLRVAGDEYVRPYPGLAAFTEDDAEYFFGRELDVEEMWRKLQRPHLLALIGPSGVGKSSFLRAGLLPARPTGWDTVIATPGSRPFTALAQALLRQLSGDTEAMEDFLRFEEPDVAVSLFARWRREHDQALVIIDQFEELFTQSPIEVQEDFAALLSRLALDADVHVLLAMRDDFLLHCQRFPALRPIFSELSPLGSLTGSALRRALVQPAVKCGYRFEDDALVDEMVEQVSEERGALPLLAFAAARLWERRDRERGLLTREAYEQIGGVGGALAQHAEATLEKLGQDRLAIVRDLFRNLVTAQGTRAAREREDLLSVFENDDRQEAERVLGTLVDARLLTTYEELAETDEEPARQHVEIIHESLLSAWPRLVRWQTQDADSAQLRDQLRQAAQMWVERGRPADLLWTGTSFQEFELWRERYAGGLSDTEEQFAAAMKAKAERRKRRRRLAVAGTFALLLGVLGVIGFYGRQSELARRRAEAETLRAEASKLLALGQLALEESPTAALAYATKSLELADTPHARRFVVEILWRGPVARLLPEADAVRATFSPSGEWLATWGMNRTTRLHSEDGHAGPVLDQDSGDPGWGRLAFSNREDLLLRFTLPTDEDGGWTSRIDRWAIPDGKRLAPTEWDRRIAAEFRSAGLLTFDWIDEAENELQVALWPSPPFPDEPGEPRDLGILEASRSTWSRPFDIDPALSRFAWSRGREVWLRPIGSADSGAGRKLGETRDEVRWIMFSPDGGLLAAADASGEVRIWTAEGREFALVTGAENPEPVAFPAFDPRSSHLALVSRANKSAYLWDLETPLDGKPLVLPRKDSDALLADFDPEGRWLVSTHQNDVAFWPVDWAYARAFRPQEQITFLGGVTFSPDSKWLASCAAWTAPHLWPLEAGLGGDHLLEGPNCYVARFHPKGDRLLLVGRDQPVAILPAAGGEPVPLGEASRGEIVAAGFDRRGRLAAAAPLVSSERERVLRVWDLESREARTLDLLNNCQEPGEQADNVCGVWDLQFAPDGSIYTSGHKGIRRWDLESGLATWLYRSEAGTNRFGITPNGRFLLAAGSSFLIESEVLRFDLSDGTHQPVQGHSRSLGAAIDPQGRILASLGIDGTIRVGPVEGGEPHLLPGLSGRVMGLDISADGRWVAAASADEIRVWPVPDLTKPPFHTLPHDELLAKLRSFTNLRAIEDPNLEPGWKLEVGPFPGWQEAPSW